ncbi:hypothetical protein F9B85_13935 [Heliorestis acidaminivorans]|uniref:Uncharacterized protein n=1 Tax=Heliorestis acidaminivorans TaxID=553427 RepID=A0A6I0EYW5_9FIRM|nr:hypothetical protein [Heliorestis acidaminivorans]KAB2950793.1 hypothetical protein F9B85_13935 [Heliorestis acidaminivorans]
MEPVEIRKIRTSQIITINTLFLLFLVTFIPIVTLLKLTTSQYFFITASIILINTLYDFLKNSPTKSIFPILEKVAIYEKEKMGDEWCNSRRRSMFMNLFLGLLFLFQSYFSRHQTAPPFQFDQFNSGFIMISVIFAFILLNTGLLMHIRKIDKSETQELRGYTRQKTLLSIVMAVVLVFLMTIVTFLYMFYTNDFRFKT